MQYPNVLSLIDAQLDRLQRARKLLLSAPPVDLSAPPVQSKVARKARITLPVSPLHLQTLHAASARATPADQNVGNHAKQDIKSLGHAPVEVAATLEPAAMPTVVIVKQKSEPKRMVRMKKQMHGEPSALRSITPAQPVAVSAVEAQRQRVQTEEMRGTGAAKTAPIPELSAEMLSQRWLRKGPAATQSA